MDSNEKDFELGLWYNLSKQVKEFRDTIMKQEMEARKRIISIFFSSPEEGTNNLPIDEGYTLKLVYPLQREIDLALLTLNTDKLTEAGISVESLIRWKPELNLTEYRKLTNDKRHMFDENLVIKPGSPSLEIVEKKK